MALYLLAPIFVDLSKVTHSWDSKFVAVTCFLIYCKLVIICHVPIFAIFVSGTQLTNLTLLTNITIDYWYQKNIKLIIIHGCESTMVARSVIFPGIKRWDIADKQN